MLGASVLDAGIPFLASNTLLGSLGCILDMPKGLIHFGAVGVTLPLRFHMGHIVAKIDCFPNKVNENMVWKQLSDKNIWKNPDPEFLMIPEASCSSTRDRSCDLIPIHAACSSATSSTRMASELAGLDDPDDDVGAADVQVNVSTCASGDVSKGLADIGDESRRRLGACHSVDPSGPSSRSQDVSSSKVPPVRQSTRQFQRVSEVQDEVQVQQGARRMGRTWPKHLAAVLLCAATFIRNNFASIPDLDLAAKEQGISKKKTGQSVVEYRMTSAASSQVGETLAEKHGYTEEEWHEMMMCYTPPPESDSGLDGYPEHPDVMPQEFPTHLFRPA